MSRRLPEFLRPPEAAALLESARSPRDRLIVLCGLGAGLRCSEITRLRVEDVDTAGRLLFVRQGKGKKDRYVCMPALLCSAMRGWIGERRVGWLFPSPRFPDRPLTTRAVQYLAERMQLAARIVRRCNPHVWRHSYATDLIRNGADITEVQQLLGHSSPNVTARYLHCDLSRLGGVVERLSIARPAEPALPPNALSLPQ